MKRSGFQQLLDLSALPEFLARTCMHACYDPHPRVQALGNGRNVRHAAHLVAYNKIGGEYPYGLQNPFPFGVPVQNIAKTKVVLRLSRPHTGQLPAFVNHSDFFHSARHP